MSIQVENSTLQSQSTSLLSQINQLQVQQGNLESFKRKVRQLPRTLTKKNTKCFFSSLKRY